MSREDYARYAPGRPYPFDPKPTPTPYPTPSDMTQYEKDTLPTVQKWGVPPPVFYGIRNAEGGKINGFNLGAVDSNPGNAMTFDNILAEATAAARVLSGNATPITYPNREQGAQNFQNAVKQRTPEEVIRAIQDAGYAGDPATWRARSIASGGAGINFPTWSDFVMATPGWRRWSTP